MTRTYDEDGQPNLSNKQMLQILVKDIPVMYKELRKDIQDLDQKLSKKIDGVDQKLTKRIDSVTSDLHQVKSDLNSVKSDLKGLRIQVHQNHTSFITNQQEMEQRIAVLETAA